MSGRPHAALGVLLTQTPELGAPTEVTGSPRFLANPCGMPRSQSPASPSSQAITGFGFRLPLQVGRRRSHCVFRSSLARPTHSLSTLRSQGCPWSTQDSLPVGGHPYRTGLPPAGSVKEVSESPSTSGHLFPLLQALPGAHLATTGGFGLRRSTAPPRSAQTAKRPRACRPGALVSCSCLPLSATACFSWPACASRGSSTSRAPPATRRRSSSSCRRRCRSRARRRTC